MLTSWNIFWYKEFGRGNSRVYFSIPPLARYWPLGLHFKARIVLRWDTRDLIIIPTSSNTRMVPFMYAVLNQVPWLRRKSEGIYWASDISKHKILHSMPNDGLYHFGGCFHGQYLKTWLGHCKCWLEQYSGHRLDREMWHCVLSAALWARHSFAYDIHGRGSRLDSNAVGCFRICGKAGDWSCPRTFNVRDHCGTEGGSCGKTETAHNFVNLFFRISYLKC